MESLEQRILKKRDLCVDSEIHGVMVDNMGYLIKDTTKEERARIVAESLGNLSASCDGCSTGIIEMYQPYIDGLKELRDVNMEFHARYVSGHELPERENCLGGIGSEL